MILISTRQVEKSEQRSHAHTLLGECLKEYGIDYVFGETPLVFGKYGKPSLAEYPDLHYNISHADGISAVIVSEYECGIDCERVRQYRPSVFKRCYSDDERRAVEAAPQSERDLLFFKLWTLKEAYVKALGRGLSFPLRNAGFTIVGESILTEFSECTFSQYIVKGEFIVSVCEISDKTEPHKILYI